MFLLMGPITNILLLYVLAAVLPAIFLMLYVYNQSRMHRKPTGLLVRLVWDGVLAALAATVLELIGESLLNSSSLANSPNYLAFLAFLIVGVVEEGTKFFFMRKDTWHNPYFETRFDGIVYCVFASLGFAAFENIKYVFSYGLGVAPSRALLAIPGHMSFAVLMGYFYGRAKLKEDCGHHGEAVLMQAIGYLAAVGLHGAYDYCAMLGSDTSTIVFFIIIIVIYLIVFRLVKHEAANDRIV